ncbi:MAG: alanine--tRNA ligase [Bacteroidales bacterium]|nr:alanine--tRNA ligase [Bacteroidales bacterium]MCB9013430.1 alanine--tRNA ligase [Bacteroidales bacterium]
MTSKELRSQFLAFFAEKNHKIVPSASMVVKNDPSLMFTNAGMNQFKDIFLGNVSAKDLRVANSQKCLRVSGKHNDLEEVGHDTYHHTMFEMLGNWSFGDYFKKEAIEWAWEFLTKTARIPEDQLYVTIFEGSKEEGISMDNEAKEYWSKLIPSDRIILGSKKDNFWEMGETGPCGPCSEIHCDIRDEADRKKIPGAELVNKGNPLVIEIWNLVFIQYNRKTNGSLESLPQQHVDTGMGFERLCMVVQGKKSNYDTDVFQDIISKIAELSGIPYGKNPESDIAMRVMADHLRAIAFSIADGQLPSNAKAGYVIRRILRRAVRHSYTFLNLSDPFLYKLIPVLVHSMGENYPELSKQEELITKVIREEEQSFLRTLETGIKLLDQLSEKAKESGNSSISGKDAFTLYDTYGFPLDLTQLILREKNLTADTDGFEKEMQEQKNRSRSDAAKETGDWIVLDNTEDNQFIGYDTLEAEVKITRYRQIKTKGKELYQLVLDKTPFYAESGGQVGDTGYLSRGEDKIYIQDTVKENNLIIHISSTFPTNTSGAFKAVVNRSPRSDTAANHSATHLLHFALREVLGSHVEQKGSLVNPDYLRFDFSHFQKVSDEEIRKIEIRVNELIRKNIPLDEQRNIPLKKAADMGAMALFGEKYGESVRVIKFGESIELCGGTHVSSTGNIGFFKIFRESAIAAGIRRIEAITGAKAQDYIFELTDQLKKIAEITGTTGELIPSIEKLVTENLSLQKQLENLSQQKLSSLRAELSNKIEEIRGIRFLAVKVELDKASLLRDLAFQLKGDLDNLFMVLGAEIDGKANLAVILSNQLVQSKSLNASLIIREISKEIEGGGGGQPFFATAGGKNPGGIDKALEKARTFIP